MMRGLAIASLLATASCATAVDRTMAKFGIAAFEAVCFAADSAERRVAAKRESFVRIAPEAAKPVLGDRPAELWGRRSFGIEALMLQDDPPRCEIGFGRAPPAEVNARLTELLDGLAAKGVTVTPLTNTGSAEQPRRSFRLIEPNGRGSIVFLNSTAGSAEFRTSLLMTERPQDLRASYRLQP